MTNFWRLLGFLKPYRSGVAWSMILAAFAMGNGTAIPLLAGAAVGRAEDGDSQGLVMIALAVIGVGLLRAGTSIGRRILSGKVSLGVEHDLRSKTYAHLQDLEIGFFHDQQTGQLMSRATVDLQVVRFFLGYGLIFMIQSAFTILFAGAIMVYLDTTLGLMVLATMPFIVAAAARYGKRARPAVQEVQQRLAELSADVEENISGIRVIKAFAREDERMARFKNSAQRVFDQNLYSTKLSAFNDPLLGFIPSIGLAAVLLYGGNLVIEGEMSLAHFTSFYFFVGMLIGPMRMLGSTLGTAQRATAAGARIFELLDRAPRIEAAPDARPFPEGGGEVVFEHVDFRFPTSDRLILKDIDLRVPAGGTIAIVGGTGSGKTTLVSLVSRLYDVDAGAITVDGADVRTLDPLELRRNVAFVAEDSFLFSASIADNIAYARDNVTREEIQEAARRAQIGEFIEQLEDGYDTVIGERGITLSGGQRQRVAIARALVADPRILILDDATSSVDSKTEQEIKGALTEVMAGRTTFVIAHRLSTISLADTIVVLDEGRVLDHGTHAELLKRCDQYRALATKGMPESVFLTRKDPTATEIGAGL
ncbi:MAG: ABC transporter ATP-binding protein [Thermoleophilaceae bacterium]|nr:ABC transporter ATP-binding protein [Thermoleophilaceae bacterium]